MSVRASRSSSVRIPPPGGPALTPSLVDRLAWQSVLFDPKPRLADLLELKATWPLSTRRIRVHRNHTLEPALSAARPFLEYAGIAPEWIVGDYDDSLAFSTAGDADAEVVWIQYSRLAQRQTPAEIASWMATRLGVLRARTPAPVLVLDWEGSPEDAAAFGAALRRAAGDLSDVHLAERGELFDALGERYFDYERAEVTGTTMSREAVSRTARLLGSRWLPALLQPRRKAVVVDLDNTLYAGVLGEDGPDSVSLTEGHAELQRALLDLRGAGVFLALLSRNEPDDVRALFDRRTDFPLHWGDFSAASIGWQAKSVGLDSIARTLRIDSEAMVVLDDNLGELLECTVAAPGLACIHAGEDARGTVAALRYLPGLWKFDRGREDHLRIADLKAGDQRDALLTRASHDLSSYYRELGVRLSLMHNDRQQLTRVAELCRKTNQFNLALRRYSESDLASYMSDGTYQISAARLEDRLTDSGVIAVAISQRQAATVVVRELCISCRALGRRLEGLIVAQLLVSGPLFPTARRLVFQFRDGPRNRPAREWLATLVGGALPPATGLVDIRVDLGQITELSVNPDVTVEVLT